MAGGERHNVTLTIQEWATAVRENPNIRTEVKKPGKLHELAVSDCIFDNSASGITHTEYLHLRTVWYHYNKNHIKNFAKLLKNDNKTGYRGFISPETDDLATRLMARQSDQLRHYLEEYHKRTQDSGYLHPSPSCGYFAMVRYWQVMTTTHTKGGGAGSSKIFKPQAGSSAVAAQASAAGRPKTPPGQQASSTPARQVAPTSASPPKFETPATKSHPAARGTASNRPSADEAYVNTALLLLLQAVTQNFHEELGSLHWVPPRMALHLKAPALNPNTQKFEEKVLLEARVDGYLCSVRDGELGVGLERPMAICEAKSSVRGPHQVATERQEAAEMAAWIRDRPGNEGLLQSSASGKKRRLMVSQDRDELYIIIGEYGRQYEAYIRNEPVKAGMTVANAKSAVANIRTSPAKDLGDTLGSPTFLNHVSTLNIATEIAGWGALGANAAAASAAAAAAAAAAAQATAGHNAGTDASGAGAPPAPPAQAPDLPSAGEFLIMHRFGPWKTDDGSNMEVLIRRLLALMLQLDGHKGQTAPQTATQTVTKTVTKTTTQTVAKTAPGTVSHTRPSSRGSAK
ncbi:hypothetical protein C8A01DRAFT_19972 [Parachaetomium inaequale]|uniref:Uncharacterized protein n=1 Tax=Parachaetomium inaequale TaxID=2588326 RepID=A0AAN6SLQ6_9PEZI|nr:hypothetical protein C8A01DRAFT_19972 [Parachaetomium inaequale]